MDKSTFAGIALALAGILGGMMIEGGKLAQILQPTAAMIVFGGTFGAVMIQYPLPLVLASVSHLSQVFFEKSRDFETIIQEVVGYAKQARKDGIVSLDKQLDKMDDPFLKKSLMLAIDGTDPQELRKMMELEMDNQTEHEEKIPQVFESAGGFSPTIGIIGAVLGLIQVMQHLDNITEVGKGIAVAFVATIYGVALANIFLLPSAGKLKIRMREQQLTREMILEGVISILEGLNPRMVETKLRGFLVAGTQEKQEKKEAEGEQKEAAS
ncbi:MAG TPA: flagellar motor protein [Terriglobia bacterium]|nr:flagellar motor protein [Terriglobia bacterium]